MKTFLSILLVLCGAFNPSHAAECGFYQAESGFLPSLGSFSGTFYTPWSLQVEAGYAVGKFIGLKQSYAELGAVLAPASVGEFQPFGQVKAYRLNNGDWASNLGAGVRWWDPCEAQIWGANLFYDYRKASIGNFNRIGVGLELLGECLDYRMNLYIPFSSEKSRRNHWIKDHRYTYQESEYAFSGVDFEVGTDLWQWDDLELEGAAGPYYYRHSEVKSIYGLQAFLGLSWMRYFAFEARVSFDNVFKTRAQGKIVLSIPLFELLCGECQDACRERITQPVRRNGVIFTKQKVHEDSWEKNF